MRFYFFELLGTVVFAITGVLVVRRRGLDVFGALVLGVVTALGGGTVRDLIISAPIFWIAEVNYVWAAAVGALGAFWTGWLFRGTYRALLYLDGLGAALFAITGVNKALLLELNGPVAVMMGVLTAIGGGLIRDVLAGRPTLLMSREIYATPILLGCAVFVALRTFAPEFSYAAVTGFAIVFGIRALAIHLHLEMPAWLTHREDGA
jgi:uncharacterized membrane protein YeiH